MVSEQVNLNHERRPYGKIEKSTKSLHPSTYVPYTMKQVRFNFFVLGLVGMLGWLSLPLVENVMVYTLFYTIQNCVFPYKSSIAFFFVVWAYNFAVGAVLSQTLKLSRLESSQTFNGLPFLKILKHHEILKNPLVKFGSGSGKENY